MEFGDIFILGFFLLGLIDLSIGRTPFRFIDANVGYLCGRTLFSRFRVLAHAERRLIMYEDVLKAQFIAMETTLAKYQATQSYLEMQTAQRNKNK